MPEAGARCAAVNAAGAKRSQAIGTHHTVINSQAPHRSATLISRPFPPGCRLPNISRPVLQAAAGTQPRRRQPSSPLLPAMKASVSLHSAAWAPTTLARRHPRDPSTPRLGTATATAGLHIAAWTTMTTRFRSPMLSCRRGLAAWAPLGSPWHRGAASGRGRITWGRLNHTIIKDFYGLTLCTLLDVHRHRKDLTLCVSRQVTFSQFLDDTISMSCLMLLWP